jgi:ribosomal protein L29
MVIFKYQELEKKSEAELHKILDESREHLRDLRFKVGSKQLKNIAEIRRTRKTIAQILFILNQRTSKIGSQSPHQSAATK